MTIYWVYILECSNGSFYTGYTNNLEKRYQEHCEGRGAKYTRSFKPLRIARSWEVADKAQAMKAEAYIKGLARPFKIKLIAETYQLRDSFSK